MILRKKSRMTQWNTNLLHCEEQMIRVRSLQARHVIQNGSLVNSARIPSCNPCSTGEKSYLKTLKTRCPGIWLCIILLTPQYNYGLC